MPRKTTIFEFDKEIAAAYKIDCEALLEKFQTYSSFNYTSFVKAWHDKKFDQIYMGHEYSIFLRDFCEIAFYTTKKYIVFPQNMHIRVGALYILYGLYYKQPFEQWIKIRLTIQEYKKIQEVVEAMRAQKQYDVLYIFSKMKIDNAFLYVAEQKLLGPEDRFLNSLETTFVNNTFNAKDAESSLKAFENLSEQDCVKELLQTNKTYAELLAKFADKEPTIHIEPQLNIKEEINTSLKRIIENAPEEEVSQQDSTGKTRQELRQKAMASSATNSKSNVYGVKME